MGKGEIMGLDAVEVLQDFYFTALILKFLEHNNNEMQKQLLAQFLVEYSTYILAEYLNTNKFESKEKPDMEREYQELKTKINSRRNEFFKNSSYSKKGVGRTQEKIREEMGIDIEVETYDTSVIVNKKNELISINYGYWDKEKYNSEYVQTLKYIQDVVNKVDEIFSIDSKEILEKEITDPRTIELLRINNKEELLYKSKSSKGLFPNVDNEADISVIYMFFEKFKNIERVAKLFEGRIIKISEVGLSYDNYIAKIQAFYICVLGDNNLKYSTSSFWDEFRKIVEKEIDSEFYPKNRCLRNKIHYTKIEKISEEDYAVLMVQQKQYISLFVKYVTDNMHWEIGTYDAFMDWAKIHVKENDLDLGEFNDNREYYYGMYLHLQENND